MDLISVIDEVRQYVDRHGLDAAIKRYAATLADWPGEPAGIWLRVSSGAQDEANQLPDVLRRCVEREFRPAIWYVLHDKSASKGEQQAKLDEMLTDMREGAIKVLVCWHDDRLERRGGMDLLKILADVKDAGGNVESTQQGRLGLETFGDRIQSFVNGEIANQKSVHLSEQVKIGLNATKRNNGVYTCLPWGYEAPTGGRRNKVTSPTDECREYWPQVLTKCAEGDSCRTIVSWLDSEKVKPTNGGNWNEDVLRRLIRNPVYCGRRLGWDNVPLLTNEAVVSVDLWKRANDALTNRPKRGPKAPTKNPITPLLANLKCLRCGSPMYRIHSGSRGRGKYYYYRCAGSGPQRKGCGNMVSLKMVEDAVTICMLAWNNEPHQIRAWVEGKNWDAEIADLTIAIGELAKNPTADRWLERMAEMQAQVVEYERKNREEREGGHWEYTDVYNDDGSVMTKGQHFYLLDSEGRREYLKEFDIRAEKITKGIRLKIGGLQTTLQDMGDFLEALARLAKELGIDLDWFKSHLEIIGDKAHTDADSIADTEKRPAYPRIGPALSCAQNRPESVSARISAERGR